MEENPLLRRLKELESLERLVEKVDRVDLDAGEGQGFDARLLNFVCLKAPENVLEAARRRKAHRRTMRLFASRTATCRRRCEYSIQLFVNYPGLSKSRRHASVADERPLPCP